MPNPFATPAPADVEVTTGATDRQRAYVASLTAEAAEMARMNNDDARAAMIEGADFSAVFCDKAATSATIERMVAANVEYRVEHGIEMAKVRTTTESKIVLPSVPAGRYAVDVEGVLKFVKVDRPTEGKWAGRTFTKYVVGDDEYPVRGAALILVTEAIAADPLAASVRYGMEIGRCGVCGRTLTNESSRAAGIGPICAAKF